MSNKLAIVGGTGAVGRVFIEYLKNHIDYNFEIGNLKVHSFFHISLNSTRNTLVNFKKDKWHLDRPNKNGENLLEKLWAEKFQKYIFFVEN